MRRFILKCFLMREDTVFPFWNKEEVICFSLYCSGFGDCDEILVTYHRALTQQTKKKDFGLPTSTQTVWWLSSKWNENKKIHYREYFLNYPRHETSQLFKDQCAVFHTDFTSSRDGKDLNNVNCLQHSCSLYSIPPKDMLQWIKRKDT